MTVGSKWQLVVPASLGYGARGAGDKIEAMKGAGIRMSDSPAAIGKTMLKVMKG